MTSEERNKAEWVSNFAFWILEMLRSWIKSFGNELIVVFTPLFLVVMQDAVREMNLFSCSDFELFRCAFL